MNVKLGLSFNYINKVRNLRVRVRLRGRIQITLFLNFPSCCHTVQEEARSRRSATTGWLFECNSPSFSLSLLPPQCNFLLSLSMSIHCLFPPHEELHFSINSSQSLDSTTLLCENKELLVTLEDVQLSGRISTDNQYWLNSMLLLPLLLSTYAGPLTNKNG